MDILRAMGNAGRCDRMESEVHTSIGKEGLLMWQARSLAFSIVPTMALLLLAVGGQTLGQQLHTLPLDAALSIYVAHVGTWWNWNTQEPEEAEIEDIVAAFAPGQQVSDDPDVWCEHQINMPPVPAGWGFFSPGAEEPMALRVIVQDTAARLGSVEVKVRDTGASVGTLWAAPDGARVDGWIAVDALCEAYNL